MSKEKNDILRNGSGYCDYTAYAAIMNYGKGEKKMEIKAGEIYEVKRNDGSFMTAIIIAVHEYTSNILFLCDTESEGAVKVICKGEKYTDISKLQYIYNDKIRTFVRKLKDEEFAEILEKVRESLGIAKISIAPAEENLEKEELNKEIDMLKYEKEELMKRVRDLQSAYECNGTDIGVYEEKIKILEEKNKTLHFDLEKIEVERDDATYELVKMETAAIERDLYKEMYENLLEKVIA